MDKPIQTITPFLWFDNQAEEAVKFYTSIFKNSKIETVTRYGETGPGPKDSVMTMAFELEAFGRRRGSTMRLAKRQIWVVVADCAGGLSPYVAGQGRRTIATSDEGDVSNEED